MWFQWLIWAFLKPFGFLLVFLLFSVIQEFFYFSLVSRLSCDARWNWVLVCFLKAYYLSLCGVCILKCGGRRKVSDLLEPESQTFTGHLTDYVCVDFWTLVFHDVVEASILNHLYSPDDLFLRYEMYIWIRIHSANTFSRQTNVCTSASAEHLQLKGLVCSFPHWPFFFPHMCWHYPNFSV